MRARQAARAMIKDPSFGSLARTSRRHNIEMGSPICVTKGRYHLGKQCRGKRCAVFVEFCGRGKTVGDVHFHPRRPGRIWFDDPATILPSVGDLEARRGASTIMCIAHVRSNLVNLVCYETKSFSRRSLEHFSEEDQRCLPGARLTEKGWVPLYAKSPEEAQIKHYECAREVWKRHRPKFIKSESRHIVELSP